MKKTILSLFIGFACGLLAVCIYELFIDPGDCFFEEAVHQSDRWAKKTEAVFPTKYVITGGSSTRCSIDPQLLLDEYNIPLIIGSLHAGYGAMAHTEAAIKYLNSGDTLILAFERGLLDASDFKNFHTTSGDKFVFYHSGKCLFTSKLFHRDLSYVVRVFRGSTYSLLTSGARILLNKPYRYNKEQNLSPSGQLIAPQWNLAEPSDRKTVFLKNYNPISSFGLEYLKQIVAWGKEKNIRVIYYIPRSLSPESHKVYRAMQALQIMDIMPVIKDHALGVDSTPSHFADTGNHANAIGTKLITRELGRALSENDFWSREELIEIIRKLVSIQDCDEQFLNEISQVK